MRLTVDVDIVLQLDQANVLNAIKALQGLGYRPRVPVPFEQFADGEMRQQWIEQKNMRVFTVTSDQHLETEIDLFVNDPLGFERAYAAARKFEVLPGVSAVVCGYEDLIKLKLQASRPKDILDIAELKQIHGEV